MRTRLRRFRDEFERHVRPLRGPLDDLGKRLAAIRREPSLAALRPRVLGLSHRLDTLADKIADEQVYVLIFGPLKSGKSTLMNAIAGAYVSEVTTLPAYPCMVYVGHGSEPSCTITRYDGSAQRLRGLGELHEVLGRAHRELAERMRSVESGGQDFDPGAHMPGAVRRIDVRMPAPALGASGALLVDTPGLYSRMKFGYDQMTRDFRGAAASAVFVVKTDNLFLEQVFDEFADLLRLFSRIFLVVNLDGTKRDLEPDGTLRRSLEGSDPQQIIDAFESLAMSAELEQARAEGRLRIYPIDLLRAASRRLRGERRAEETDEQAGEAEGEEGDAPSLRAFDSFLADLAEYLNGDEHLVAFLGDALRQGGDLLDEAVGLGDEPPLAALEQRIREREEEVARCEALSAAAGRLEGYAWEEPFGRLREDVMRIVRERSAELRRRTGEWAEGALARWFESDASYASLVGDELRPALLACRDGVLEVATEVSRTVIASDVGGAIVRREVSEDIGRLGLSLTALCREALETVVSPSAGAEPVLELSPRVVPVKRSLVDWLLFRSRARVRQRLLGPDDAPSRPVPRRVKRRRLRRARVDLAEALRARLDLFYVETTSRVAAETFGAHVAAVCRDIRTRLAEARAWHREAARAAEAQLAELREVEASWRSLREAVGGARAALRRLAGEPVGAPDLAAAGPAADAVAALDALPPRRST